MPMNNTQTVLEARSIGRNAASGERLLNSVTFTVNAGEKWAITGATGAGKTLLLRALALLDPIETGEVLWRGEAIADDQIPRYRRDVIFLHQRAVLTEGTVATNLHQPFSFKTSANANHNRDAIVGNLTRLGQASQFLEKFSKDLSGGEAQIVAFLRAMQLNPSVLLLDEPTSAMDAGTVERFESLISDWIAEPRTERAYVWVSHDPDQIARVSDHCLRLESGKQSNFTHDPT